ncbi:MAG: glycosyltransferase [Planctomycetes bacterium]|nr:glycosyltransferase [Planctomycetota bacterium]
MPATPKLGIVAIGRNEGERLVRSLRSLADWRASTVYVDSASTDGSVAFARDFGVSVVQLDTTIPFTAGRARNAGYENLLERLPDVEYVQFVDGDCEVEAGWIERAVAEMERNPQLGVVCGRRRERFRDATVWNRLCDMEWNTPIGRAGACGGDALYRVSALRAAGGFDPRLVAGEEPELCVRVRGRGFSIERLDAPMTIHDVAMTRFSQWWRRASRNGHAIVGSLMIHGAGSDHDWGRQLFRSAFWVGAILWTALAALVLAFSDVSPAWKWTASALPLALFVLVWSRTYRSRRKRGDQVGDCAIYATFVVLGKIPECLGAWSCWRDHVRGRSTHWIEYKPVPARSAGERS